MAAWRVCETVRAGAEPQDGTCGTPFRMVPILASGTAIVAHDGMLFPETAAALWDGLSGGTRGLDSVPHS